MGRCFLSFSWPKGSTWPKAPVIRQAEAHGRAWPRTCMGSWPGSAPIQPYPGWTGTSSWPVFLTWQCLVIGSSAETLPESDIGEAPNPRSTPRPRRVSRKPSRPWEPWPGQKPQKTSHAPRSRIPPIQTPPFSGHKGKGYHAQIAGNVPRPGQPDLGIIALAKEERA
jgi:hypothetical protein